MLAKLCIELDTESWNYQKSSRLQGFMMEHLRSEYVEALHKQEMHPYSQALLRENGRVIWQICTMSEEACDEIIKPLEASVEAATLHNEKESVPVKGKAREETDFSELLGEFYQGASQKNITVDFLTPTAFKQKGRYIIMPDVRLICQSLMLRQASLASSFDMMDGDALQEIAENCLVTRHRIHSTVFPAEKTNIPGFVGSVTFRCFGSETMARYLRLLLRFGEFSGVGIKTGMGMGAMRLRREAE